MLSELEFVATFSRLAATSFPWGWTCGVEFAPALAASALASGVCQRRRVTGVDTSGSRSVSFDPWPMRASPWSTHAPPVAHEWPPPPACHHLEAHSYPSLIDIFRLETLAVPPHHRLVLLVERVAHRFQELHEAQDSANVVGRTSPLALHKRRVVDVGLALPYLFDEQIVTPLVTEVVDVQKPFDSAANDRLQAQARRFVDPALAEQIVLRFAVDSVPYLELEEVRIGPAKRNLLMS